MLTKRVVDSTSISTTTNSSSVNVHMPKSIRGIVQYRTQSGSSYGSITFTLEGRLSDDMGWVLVASTSSAHSSDTTTSVEDISLYPQMRAVMTVSGATATCDVQIGC